MIEADFDLVGRYFVRLDSDNIGMEGWIRKNLGSGFYVVEVFFKTAQGFETVLTIVHFVELRDARFYKDPPAAQRDQDAIMMQALQPIDFEAILCSASEELEDVVLEFLKKSRDNGQDARAQELISLLKTIVR